MPLKSVEIAQPKGPLDGRIRPPGSKSITNRALLCAAVAQGDSTLRGVLESEDTEVMMAALRKLGVQMEFGSDSQLTVHGASGKFQAPGEAIFVANSGTTVRFLTAMLAAVGGRFELDGVARMRERPIEDLLVALRSLGAEANSLADNGCPPVELNSAGLAGGTVCVRGDISSQYLSGLLMAAPLAQADVELVVEGNLVSRPYVDMTLAVMRSFGAQTETALNNRFTIKAPQGFRGAEYDIEPDASAASYFWGAAAIAGGRVTVEGLSRNALQGDVAFCDCLEKMGCQVSYRDNEIRVSRTGPLHGVDIDMNAISDTVQTLAAVALYADGPTTIRGVAHNRHKETDRIGDLARELRKLGADVEERADGMVISPGTRRPAEVDTYNDHRMAMSLALVGLRTPGVVIRDPECTVKTYPNFFDDFRRLTIL